jgi:acetyl/propionyl-CoA carboxylase alpha subunit/acetyl-CoA carboxylase carboxyltransferase component
VEDSRVPIKRLLVANRGEIAVRVMHTALAIGVPTVAVAATDDRSGAHLRWAGQVESLEGAGPAAYLDQETLLAIAARTGCDAVHPGYGFLSERADFAARCEDAGLVFVGSSPGALELFGDKVRARDLARDLGLDVLAGTGALTGRDPDADVESVRALLAEHGPVMVKAVAGGGGRGIQPVREADELANVLRRCRSEAASAFGDGTLYAERLLPAARHIEVQLIGDHQGTVRVLGDRDCSLQRRRQKVVEIAPAPGLSDPTRQRLWDAAVALGEAAPALGLATAEFLVTEDTVVFLEVNPRLQVEHTVTEQVTGLDLVELQLQIADGVTLEELLLEPSTAGPVTALQARVNAERVTTDGTYPGGGRLTRFAPPTGRAVRVDTHCGPGYEISPSYDSLLAKVITTGSDPRGAAALAQQALAEFEIAGSPTNLGLLRAVLGDASLWARPPYTDHLDRNLPELLEIAARLLPDEEDGRSQAGPERDVSSGVLRAPMAGVVVELPVSAGSSIPRGGPAVVLEAMKMEHAVAAPEALVVHEVLVSLGDTVTEGTPLLRVEPSEDDHDQNVEITESDLERIRDDLAESRDRHRRTLDEGRPDAVRRRHDSGRRTARENVEDLCDPGTFVEYGALAVAAQRRRRSMDDLIAKTPGDGMVTGTARIGGLRCAVLSYDYTVLAGTQGVQNHRKTDRLLELARRERLPVVLFAEGGGGRPGDTDQPGFSGLDVLTFHTAADLSGVVPTIAVVGGYCFAGNTALAAACDVLIATEGSSIGMGGPAMISGGGLGDVSPDEVGPSSALYRNGVVDVLVPDDASAVTATRSYLSYLSGRSDEWSCADQRLLRTLVPENRVRTYPIRPVLETLFDTASVLELRGGYGAGMITAFARLEGSPVGVFANNPGHLGGAIDAEAAAKTAWFLRLCDSYRLPVVSLCDTPGFMVGPAAEREGTVEQAGQMFIAGAKLRTQLAMVVLRKGYGLAAMAMAGGALRTSALAVGWPTGEFGGMNLEGAVRLGYRKELAAIEDPEARQVRFDELVARAYKHGKALTTATVFDIDDVIDPADTRAVLALALGLPREPGTDADG